MNSKWTYDQVVVLDQNFHLNFNFKDIVLYINKDNYFVLKIKDQEFIGPLLLNLENRHWVHYALSCSPSDINLYLNAKHILQVTDDKLIFSKDNLELDPSLVEPSRKFFSRDLSPWVNKRQSMFKIKKETSEDYALIPVEQQMEQLNKNIMALEELITAVTKGKTHFIDHIIANLRSLLFYKKGSKSYDPLLLRIATYKKIGLPVFVLQKFNKIDSSALFTVTHLASFHPNDANTTMIDFQEYLESTIIYSEKSFLTPLTFIENSATTKSIAHFDQRIPRTIHNFEELPIINNTEMFQYVTIHLASLTVQIGKYILQAEKD